MNLPIYEEVFFVHYLCDPFGKGSKIYYLNIHAKGNTTQYDSDEKEAIKEYCKVVAQLLQEGLRLVHWNQDSPHYGPQHIRARYSKIAEEEIDLDYGNCIGLSSAIIDEYGDKYIDHGKWGRLDSLAALNNFSGSSEGKGMKTFATDRVRLISKIYYNFIRGTLLTNKGTYYFKLNQELENAGFFSLPKVKNLPLNEQEALVKKISESSLALIIAWLQFLGFLTLVYEQNNQNGKKRNEYLARILEKSSETIKKEITSLSPSSVKNKKFLSYTYLKDVESEYNNIK
jgi:hypothetical protein